MSDFWRDKTVIVTGGAGFLGSYVIEKLKERGPAEIIVPRSEDYDLRHIEAVRRLFSDALEGRCGERSNVQPSNLEPSNLITIHLAARVGGIGANRAHPAEFFYDNLMMGAHLIHEAWQAGAGKFAALGTVCAYPKFGSVPFKEDEFWDGYPEETNAPYGLAKKSHLVQLQAYRAQYGFNGIYLVPVNLYGPWDNFDLETSHVIPALIRKCVEAKERGEEEVVVWGTGEPTREFFYVEDCAEAILLATERYDGAEPVNLGSGREIKIRDLAELIARLTGFDGKIVFDTSRPDGQPRRLLDVSRAQKEFGFRSRVGLEDGLKRTIQWFLDHRQATRLGSRAQRTEVKGSLRR